MVATPGPLAATKYVPEGTAGAQLLLDTRASDPLFEKATSGFVEVDPDLERAANALREAFNVHRWKILQNVALVPSEIARAIREAEKIVRAGWIPHGITLVHIALMHRYTQELGAVDLYALNRRPPPPTTPATILAALVEKCNEWSGLPPPPDVDETMIAWMLEHLAVGTARGGGRNKRMNVEQMRRLLADEKRRAKIRGPK